MYKQRIAYIDLVKGIGILCVLFGHLIPNDGIVKPAIYSFHMPLFFSSFQFHREFTTPSAVSINGRCQIILFRSCFLESIT